LSEYVPVAVYCSVFPAARLMLGGVIVIDCKVAGVTVTVVAPVIPDRLAVIVGSPVAAVVIRPPVTAAPPPLEAHVAWPVMSAVLPSK
jgi:hypothetical protein